MLNTPTPRRSFVAQLSAGAAALLAGRAALAHAEVRPGTADAIDPWVAKVRGKYRQVFDAVSPNEGLGAAFALNFIDSATKAHSLTPSDISAVLVLRHMAMPLALNDAAWAKYHIGEMLNVTDPSTKAPATRNIYRTNIMMRPGLSYEEMAAKRGVVITACGMALTLLAGMMAEKMKMDPAATEADWKASIIPGAYVAPSGVYAVNRAQQAGCTYCYAG